MSDWEKWMGLHFGAYIDGQVRSWLVMESCSASLISRMELAANFTLTTAGGVLIPSLESSIPKGGESNHSFLIALGFWRAAHLLLANEVGTFACSLSGLVGPILGACRGFSGLSWKHFFTQHHSHFHPFLPYTLKALISLTHPL